MADMVADALRRRMGDWALMSGYRGTSMGVAPSAGAMGSYQRIAGPQQELLGQQMDWWRMNRRWTDEAIKRTQERAKQAERWGLGTDIMSLILSTAPQGNLFPGIRRKFSQTPDPYADAVRRLLGDQWDPFYGGGYAPPSAPEPAPEPYGGWTA